MVLYVIRPPAPPAGEDWQTAVPGQYIYNVTAVYATLTTGGTHTFVMADSSGNGRDGAYDVPPDGATPIIEGVPATFFSQGPHTRGLVSVPILDWSGDFSIEAWLVCEPGIAVELASGQDDTSPTPAVSFSFIAHDDGVIELSGNATGGGSVVYLSAAGAVPFDGDAHQIAVAYVAGDPIPTAVVDGVAHAMTTGFPGTLDLTGIAFVGVLGPVIATPSGTGYVGAMAQFYAAALSVGQFAAHYVTRGNGGDFIDTVLADAPAAFYELADQGGAGGGRQVTLDITDGTHEVEEIPTGFDIPAQTDPYSYSWQPSLRAASQSPGTNLTAIPMPPEILPAGYTIGTKTLDLQPTDQWGDIAVWWNSDVMDGTQDVTPYAYPPGALLLFQRLGQGT